MLALDSIDQELAECKFLHTIMEQGQFVSLMHSKYFHLLKNNDEFDKMLLQSMQKHEYHILKIGSGNYVVNPGKYR